MVLSHLQVGDAAQQHGGSLRVLGYLLPEVVVPVELFLLLFLIATISAALAFIAAAVPQRVEHLEVEAGLLLPFGSGDQFNSKFL